MKYLIFFTVLFFSLECRADIKFIKYDKIDPAGKYQKQFQFLLDNLVYYDHWNPDWPYEVGKDSLIGGLKNSLALFGPLKTNELESDLLLGEIAHYLYNLDQQPYFDTAENYFLRAVGAAGKDCRGYWFLGYFYAQSDHLVKAAAAFEAARKLVTVGTGVDFWQEYGFAMSLANKPSHARFAIDAYLRLGGRSDLSHIMDSTLRSKMKSADPDSTYTDRDLWEVDGTGALVPFVSRSLGIRLKVDSGSQVQIEDFKNRTNAFILSPGRLKSAKGTPIGYHIALIIKVAEKGETLEQFVTKLSGGKGKKDAQFVFSDLYPGGISLTAKDPTMYKEGGGAYGHFVGIERNSPPYPGMALEETREMEELNATPGELNVMTMPFIRSRFPGRIFYFFVLDTCEDIHAQSWKAFEALVRKQMVLD